MSFNTVLFNGVILTYLLINIIWNSVINFVKKYCATNYATKVNLFDRLSCDNHGDELFNYNMFYILFLFVFLDKEYPRTTLINFNLLSIAYRFAFPSWHIGLVRHIFKWITNKRGLNLRNGNLTHFFYDFSLRLVCYCRERKTV